LKNGSGGTFLLVLSTILTRTYYSHTRKEGSAKKSVAWPAEGCWLSSSLAHMKKTVIAAFSSPLLGVLLGLGALIALLQAQVALAAEQANGCASTTKYSIPVTLSAGDPTVYHIAGWLYSLGPAAGKTVQVVIHGATYDQNYFNSPYQPGNYSYVDYLIGAGYAVLDIDRIGSGLSDHPADPEEVTIVSGAYTIHQIVQGLRNGTIAGIKFEKVMLVGHSVGSAITLVETAIYNDVDGGSVWWLLQPAKSKFSRYEFVARPPE
jgi:hypothetical protein